MAKMFRHQQGVCNEKGEIIALFIKGAWYEPKVNRIGVLEMESCLKDKSKMYESLPITYQLTQQIIPIDKTDSKNVKS